MSKLLKSLVFVLKTVKDIFTWIFIKIKQAFVWLISKFINVCKCDR